jgi:cell fate regulator YaaT (PSP1 superfamily)
MSIFPLPVFEQDADPSRRSAMTDEEVYARLEPPKTIVVRFGSMKMVGEYPYDGDAKPGCGSRLVARTHRGTELGEMLTTTCSNAGCGKSVTRKELLEYIQRSGGPDYPFHTEGRILRVATVKDLQAEERMTEQARAWVPLVKQRIAEAGLEMKVVEIEPILGGELVTVHYTAPDRVDFRELLRVLSSDLQTRVLMHQVGARDEARLIADYERCGQYCCCKNFLKVLKPISMGAAKMQKATLDPLKISGRCGRLMCCLRYEDASYRELKARLPNRRARVGTTEGPGIVVDTKTLVQLVLVRLEHDGREIAVPVEELLDPETCPRPGDAAATARAEAAIDPLRGAGQEQVRGRAAEGDAPPERRRRRKRGAGGSGGSGDAGTIEPTAATPPTSPTESAATGEAMPVDPASEPGGRSRRRRRRRGRGGSGGASAADGGDSSGGQVAGGDPPPAAAGGSAVGEGGARKRRRRRRRSGGGGGGGEGAGGGSTGPDA